MGLFGNFSQIAFWVGVGGPSLTFCKNVNLGVQSCLAHQPSDAFCYPQSMLCGRRERSVVLIDKVFVTCNTDNVTLTVHYGFSFYLLAILSISFVHEKCQGRFLDAIASPSTYPRQSVGQSVTVSDLEIAIASPSFATVFYGASGQYHH